LPLGFGQRETAKSWVLFGAIMLTQSVRSLVILSAMFVAGAVAIGRPAQADTIYAPTIEVTSVTHAYGVGGKESATTSIADSIQSASSETWTTHWHNPPTWVSTLTAPDGYRFVVNPAAGFVTPTTMSLAVSWYDTENPVLDYTVFFASTSFAFDGLTGVAPMLTGSSGVVGQALYTLSARANFIVSAPFSFTSVTFTTSPPYDLSAFQSQFYASSPMLTVSASGNGVLPNSTLLSLQPVPEPATLRTMLCGMILVAAFWSLGRTSQRRTVYARKREHGV
jgi:hypothetical protein